MKHAELIEKYTYLLETQEKRDEYFKLNKKYKGKANAKGQIKILQSIIQDLNK